MAFVVDPQDIYWQRVSNHPYVSDDFRTIARGNVIKLKNTR